MTSESKNPDIKTRRKKRKEKRTFGKRSLMKALTKSHVLFSFVVISIVTLGFIYAILSSTNIEATDEFLRLSNHIYKAQQGQYKNLPLKKIMGKTSFIQIVDEAGRVVHTEYATEKPDDVKEPKTYTERELAAVCNFDEFITMEENDNAFLFTKHKAVNNELEYIGSLTANKSGEIVYSDDPYLRGRLSDQEHYFLKSYIPEIHTVKKQAFLNNRGQKLYLIAFAKVTKINHYARIIVHMIEVIILGIVFYMAMVVLFVFWTKRKIEKPIKELEKGLERFRQDARFVPIHYKGLQELEEICESFNIMAEEISKADEERSEMIADIAHDLKTPLTVLNGYVKALSDGMVPEDKVPSYLELIQDKSRLLVDLIENFRNYSMMKRGDFVEDMVEIEICEFVRSYFAAAYQDLAFNGYDLRADISDDKLYIKGDKMMLNRMFSNFVSNTVSHNTKGTTFKVKVEGEGDRVKLTIGDDGKGISEKDEKNIFQPFFTGYEAREQAYSSGLGMAIIKDIVNRHGGMIKIKRPADRGYSIQFEIYFNQLQG